MTTSPQRRRLFRDADLIRKAIRELKSLDLSIVSFDDLNELVMNRFGGIASSYASIDIGTKLYRARRNISSNQRFALHSELSLPPSARTREFGRANRPGHPILYTASNPKLASYEVMNDKLRTAAAPHLDEIITIGVWEVTARLTVANIIHNNMLIQTRPSTALCNQYIDACLSRNLAEEDIESDKEICTFFCDEYVKAGITTYNDYKYSALFSHYVDHNFNGFYDGVNYPSVACRYIGDNQAIFPRSIRAKLKYVGCVEILCRLFPGEAPHFSFIVLSESYGASEGEIVWNDFNYERRNVHDLEAFLSDNHLKDTFTKRSGELTVLNTN